MKKTSRKFLSFFMSLVMVLSLFSMLGITSFAASSGNFTYEVKPEDNSCIITSYTGTQTDVTVPATIDGHVVTEIGAEAFAEKAVVNVILPDTITTIGELAFGDCKNLEYFNISLSLTTIGDGAFFGCDSLAGIAIPNTVTYIGELALGYSYEYTPDGETQLIRYINFPILGYAGSAAETYAKDNKLPFIEYNDNPNISYMYRLYNPNSGEHFYTANVSETADLIILGWKFEGIGWIAPASSLTPVYRLYNQNGGEHHYTLSAEEIDILVSAGWKLEGIGWYSDDAKSVPVYRQYNPNAFANNHNYTINLEENDWLVTMGWRAEGIGWYGVVA